MTECLLKSRIKFMDVSGYDYIHVVISDTNGISIDHITRERANQIAEKLSKVDTSEYDSKYGYIYCNDGFKNYVNSYPTLKRNLLFLLENDI